MKYFRNRVIFRYIWVFMAIHILNCSIDSPDALPDTIAEDLSYNDIESVSELVMEQFLGFENAIAEHEEPDNADGYSFEFVKILLYFQSTSFIYLTQISEINIFDKININYTITFYCQFHPDIIAPPPQRA